MARRLSVSFLTYYSKQGSDCARLATNTFAKFYRKNAICYKVNAMSSGYEHLNRVSLFPHNTLPEHETQRLQEYNAGQAVYTMPVAIGNIAMSVRELKLLEGVSFPYLLFRTQEPHKDVDHLVTPALDPDIVALITQLGRAFIHIVRTDQGTAQSLQPSIHYGRYNTLTPRASHAWHVTSGSQALAYGVTFGKPQVAPQFARAHLHKYAYTDNGVFVGPLASPNSFRTINTDVGTVYRYLDGVDLRRDPSPKNKRRFHLSRLHFKLALPSVRR